MTYKDLLMRLSQLTPEQLRCDVIIHNDSQDEYWGNGTDIQLTEAEDDNGVLDPGHPVIKFSP